METKQHPSLRAPSRDKQDPLDEVLGVTNNVMAKLDWPDYEDAIVTKGEEFSMLAAHATMDDIMVVLDVPVNIPDLEMREIIASGGKRMGLIDLQRDTRNSVFKTLRDGRAQGDGPYAIARRFREDIPKGRFRDSGTRAKVIARTESKYAQNVSSVKAYKGSGVITGLRIFDAQLGDTDSECEERNNNVIDFEEGQNITETEHPNGTLSFAPEVDQEARRQKRLTERQDSQYKPPAHNCPLNTTSSVISSSQIRRRDPVNRFSLASGRFSDRAYDRIQTRASRTDWTKRKGFISAKDDVLLNDYFGEGAPSFHAINSTLRTGRNFDDVYTKKAATKLKRTVKKLDESSVKLDRNEIVYRGMNAPLNVSVGDVMPISAPTSTTIRASWAQRFGIINDDTVETLMELKVKRGSRVIITNPVEQELVLMPGQALKVTKIRQNVSLKSPPELGDDTRWNTKRFIQAEIVEEDLP